MSATLILWIGLLTVLTYFALFRGAAWGFSVYCLTFFACPPFWWWGGTLKGYPWSMIGGLILLTGVVLDSRRTKQRDIDNLNEKGIPLVKLPHFKLFLFLMFLNNSFVHFVITEGDVISAPHYFLMLKIIFLCYLIEKVIKTHDDLRIVLISLMLGIAFIGFQATINDIGHMVAGRLEGIGAPGATGSNLLACLIVSILPFSGVLIITAESKWVKVIAFICSPFIFNLLLLCNSRGAFLACILSGIFIFLFTKGKQWKYTVAAIVLSIAGIFSLVNNQKIIDRFETTFVDASHRDRSASSRLLFWQAAMEMISDHPFGAGGDGFKKKYGKNYLVDFGVDRDIRAVHNGYLNEACEWGVQGLFLKLILYTLCALSALKASNVVLREYGNYKVSYLGKSLIACLVGFLGATMFLDSLDAEWGYWIAAILYSYAKLVKNGYFQKPDTGF